MIAHERIVRQAPAQLVAATPVQTPHNNNWFHSGTDDAWLNTDYSQAPYNICTEAETTAYKLPQCEEDWDCYSNESGKTDAEISAELESLDPEWIHF